MAQAGSLLTGVDGPAAAVAPSTGFVDAYQRQLDGAADDLAVDAQHGVVVGGVDEHHRAGSNCRSSMASASLSSM